MVELDDFYIFTANGWTRWLVNTLCVAGATFVGCVMQRDRCVIEHACTSLRENIPIYIYISFLPLLHKRKQNLWGYPVLKLKPTERIQLCVPPWSAVTVGHVNFCGLGKAWNYGHGWCGLSLHLKDDSIGQWANLLRKWEDEKAEKLKEPVGRGSESLGSGRTEVWMLHKYTDTEAIPVAGELGIGTNVNSKGKTWISILFSMKIWRFSLISVCDSLYFLTNAPCKFYKNRNVSGVEGFSCKGVLVWTFPCVRVFWCEGCQV